MLGYDAISMDAVAMVSVLGGQVANAGGSGDSGGTAPMQYARAPIGHGYTTKHHCNEHRPSATQSNNR